MGDENPIRTLEDYSKPSHEGYRNTIELPVGNNVVPLQSDTIRLVQNGCSFHGLRSEDPNQHLKDFLKLVDSLDLDGSITTWEDLTTRFLAQFYPPGRTAKLRNDILTFQQHHGESLSEAWTPGGRLRKLSPDEAWATIERVAQYEDEGWNDAFTSEEVSFNYENPDVEQLLGIMKCKVDTLMKDAISLMGKSESVFWSKTNEMCRPPTEPLRQEEFEHIVMNFIYDQEDRIRQLENYMQDITDEFMEFSLEVALRLKKRIKENESKPRKIENITKYPDTKALENSAKHNFFENVEKKTFPTSASLLCVRLVPLQPEQFTNHSTTYSKQPLLHG
ncbi:zinc finger, CCHC-type containing protein [Tanacetum coccineum]